MLVHCIPLGGSGVREPLCKAMVVVQSLGDTRRIHLGGLTEWNSDNRDIVIRRLEAREVSAPDKQRIRIPGPKALMITHNILEPVADSIGDRTNLL